MDQFCGSIFWDLNITWETPKNPDFTYCFEDTVLLWAPCLLLWILTIPHVISLIWKEAKTGNVYDLNKANDMSDAYEMHSNGTNGSIFVGGKGSDEKKQIANGGVAVSGGKSNGLDAPIPWTVYSIIKLGLSLCFVILAILELVATLWLHRNEPLELFPVNWIAPIVKGITFLYLANIVNLYRRNAVYSSGPIFVFGLLFAIYSLVNFRTMILAVFSDGHYYPEFHHLYFVSRCVSTVFAVGLLVVVSLSEYTPDKKFDPHQTSSFLNKITFWWMTKLIIKGYRRPLTENDMYRMNPANTSKVVLADFEQKIDALSTAQTIKRMENEAATGVYPTKSKNERDQPQFKFNVAFIILRLYWVRLLGVGILKFIASCMTFANPIIMDWLLTFMGDKHNKEPTWRGFVYAAMMFISPMFESLLNNQHDYWMNIIILRVRTCMISMIYNKSLKLSTFGRKDYSTGEIVNIMSVDSQRLVDFLNWINTMWSAPLQFAIAIYLLWRQVGYASMAGVVFMFILMPFNGWISTKIRGNQMLVMKEKDKRTKLMNEILNGMKVLKLYAWENSFRDKIAKLRDFECKQLYKIAYLSGFMFFAFTAAPFLVGLFTFAIYVLTGHDLNPNKAFVSLSLFNIIRLPMGMLPMLFSMGAMCLVSIKRINKYLNSENLDEDSISYKADQECAILVKNATFTWDRDGEASLKNINFEIPHGKLVALVGSVGAGKSSLLSGILGDMEKTNGTVNMDGRVAFVPQQAWVQNATLRKNVTFTNNFDEKKYRKVIKNCCMEPDISILADGDQTEIGERGINLSGGQKQRISLARAVYSDAQIYLLDDPLSAVDAHVGKSLFENVISNKGMLGKKTRVLATHRISVLNEVDEIFVVKDGVISERGTMDELIDKKGAFAEFIAEYLSENMDDVADDSDDTVELMKSLAEKVRPILERSESTRSKLSNFSRSSSVRSSMDRKSTIRSSNHSMRKRNTSSMRESQQQQQPQQTKKPPGGGEGKGKLISVETAQTGSVKLKVYVKYFETIGLSIVIMILASMIVSNGFQVASSLWLSAWSNDALTPDNVNNTKLRNQRLGGYAGFGAGEIFASLFSTVVLNIACVRASKLLHNEMLSCIMFAPMAFFDTTPIGRILNRFTKDVDTADSAMVFNIRMATMQFFRTIVAFIMISLQAPIILVAILPIIVLYYIIQRVYIATSRQLKRIESTTRSPIYNHFNETVNGANSIRAYGVQDKFIADSNRRIDHNNSSFYASITAARWLSVRLEFLGYTIVFLAAIFAVISRGTITPGLAGLAISYSLNITGVLGMFVRSATDLETNIVSIERLTEYAEIESEAKYYNESTRPPVKEWPKKGTITFNNYSTRYRAGLDLVVKDVNFSVKSQEKVGIVGRTGAGKSSLTLALFRIIEPSGGKICIDDVDVCQLGLYDLRSRITIIPQDPVLFTGDLRMNLDPFEVYTDEDIWRALELAHLKEYVQGVENQLMYKITEGGDNLSVGQRQLVCLARALLRKSKILVLDEATAAVDMETDGLIQETIRKEFSDCTIVTIAHRLNTVIDYDRILVLDQGHVVEYDSPNALLAQKTSTFYSMAKDAKLV